MINPIILQTFEQFFERFPYCKEIIGFDTETTGFHNSDRIIEIGAAGFKYDGCDLEYIEFDQFIDPERSIPEEITKITGITDDMVNHAKCDIEVYPQFAEFIKDATMLVGHNVQFDRRMLFNNFARVGLSLDNFDERLLCTLVKAKRIGLSLPDLKLSTLAEHFGYTNEHAHRAKDDALTTLFVWGKLALQS